MADGLARELAPTGAGIGLSSGDSSSVRAPVEMSPDGAAPPLPRPAKINVTSQPQEDSAPSLQDSAQNPREVVHNPQDVAQKPQDASSVAKAPADRAADTLAHSTAQTTPPVSVVDTPSFSWGSYFQALSLLFFILALLWMAVYFVRKHGKFRFMPSPGDFPRDGLQVEAQLPIGPRKGLVVVRFLNKRLLLGVTEQQITMLSEGMTDHADVGRKFEDLIREADSQEIDGR